MTVVLGEIRMFAGTKIPNSFTLCDGKILSVQQNQALFNLIGTTYGGNGSTTFGVPDMRGRLPVGYSATWPMGFPRGAEQATVNNVAQLPKHNHRLRGTELDADLDSPAAASPAVAPFKYYSMSFSSPQVMNANAITDTFEHNPAAHENMSPFLAINFAIATSGAVGREHSDSESVGTDIAFVGEVRFHAASIIPRGWLLCNGASENVEKLGLLFKQIGHTYGGEEDDFNLPNLVLRAPIGVGHGPGLSVRVLGEAGGVPAVQLNETQVPAHNHQLNISTSANRDKEIPTDAYLLQLWRNFNTEPSGDQFDVPLSEVPDNETEEHNNWQEYLVINAFINWDGIIP